MCSLQLGYKITTDSNFLDKQNAITPELSSKLESFHKMALEGKKSSVQKILDAIDQYPDNPQLKNYLSVLYGQLNENEKMYETNRWIISEHPDYLFGKLNLANEYYLKQEYEKMPEILGDAMELKLLYPQRDTFHINEVFSFLKCAVQYFTAVGNIHQAEIRYDIMNELVPEASDTKFAMQLITIAHVKAIQRNIEEEEKSVSVKTKSQEVKNKRSAPKFFHDEIEWLYTNGLYIGEEKLNVLLKLPKNTLTKDLELVLQDSIDRYGFFNNLAEENDWGEEKMNFVVHAIFLLGEIEATDSLDAVLNVLSQSDEYIDLYLGDFITTMLWEPLYKISNNDLDVYKQFMFKPGINTYAKTTIAELIEQIVLHHPERREEAVKWFKDVIEFFINSKFEDNVIDSDLIGLLICTIIDLDAKELLPDIELLFEKGIVAIGACGDWQEVQEAFGEPDKLDRLEDILNISERYEQITSTWAGYNEDDYGLPLDFDDYDEPTIMPVRAEPKIGRNDPCPCGSGKKYKKCCLNE